MKPAIAAAPVNKNNRKRILMSLIQARGLVTKMAKKYGK
jgi:hypothetical protein